MPTCILAGATGLTGQFLWPILAEKYEQVHLLLRRPIEGTPENVQQHIIDFDQLDNWQPEGSIDHVYSTLGTTQATAGSKPAFYKVDHDYIVGMGQLARRSGASCYTFISSIGADANSWTSFYLKVKGETEVDIKSLDLPRTLAIRPSLLVGPRKEYRPAEVWGERFFKLLEPLMIGGLKRYKAVHVKTVAQAMIGLTTEQDEPGFHIVQSEDLHPWG